MFNATYFTYGGVSSETYGLKIADFDTDSHVETTAFSPTLNINKPTTLNRFIHNGIKYEDAPQYQFSVLSETPITDVNRRAILSWLVGRSEFKVLQIHQADLEDYSYRCVFTDTDIIFVNGACHGFRVTATFDSPYQRGASTSVSITGTGSQQTVTLTNNSDIVDDYVYPMVVFSALSASGGYAISIVNSTDDASRAFRFSSLGANEQITVDNELRYISSSLGGEKLSNFNKNWLRLRKGANTLKVTINGTATITCPSYVMLGF